MYNKGKSVIAEKLTRTLKIINYKCMAAILKNVYIDVLDKTVNEYNNNYQNH